MPVPSEGEQFAVFFNALLDGDGLSGAQAARRLKVAQSQVSRWRRGEGGISLENLQRIHDTFGTDLAYLMQLAGYRASSLSTAQGDISPELAALLDAEHHATLGEMRDIPAAFWPTVIATQRAARRMAVDVARSAIELVQGTGAISLVPEDELAPPGHRRRRDDKAPAPPRSAELPTALHPVYAY